MIPVARVSFCIQTYQAYRSSAVLASGVPWVAGRFGVEDIPPRGARQRSAAHCTLSPRRAPPCTSGVSG